MEKTCPSVSYIKNNNKIEEKDDDCSTMILESSSLLHLRKDQLHIAGIREPGARYIPRLQLDAVSDFDQKLKIQNSQTYYVQLSGIWIV